MEAINRDGFLVFISLIKVMDFDRALIESRSIVIHSTQEVSKVDKKIFIK
jgi:hypothetical protein